MAHFKYIKIIINIVSLIETLLSKFQKVQKKILIHTTRNSSYCSGFVMAVAKTAVICHILRHFFGLLL